MIRYRDTLDDLKPAQVEGFFVGWPTVPPPERHLELLRGSYAFVLAADDDTGRVVGFVSAISDGVLSAHIPLLEVLPEYQSRGIGRELVTRLLPKLPFAMVDLTCDHDLQPFYERFGMLPVLGMVLRDASKL